ncbi:conjugal transfer protein TraH [Acidithiobacillus sp. HP-6]|uniref:conjugal transfer protein TraH n=1 Tax=unclassified Acidithiobacillus TaxID=2614800 RepID=UPI00187AE58F|nr:MULTISPECIES: conjugal transfer protein TraH [unclassified Acidithiobacillus]MBE7562708.1 conjugal transfer protein TraH [Acidithiobacillus sp. HP-6]MBE7570496.1 conjugal transfer protein TraH [Acidithiobacillus sp. HP-2]
MAKTEPFKKKISKGVLLAMTASLVTTSMLQSEAAYAGMQGFLSGMFAATSVPQAASLGNGVTLSGGYAEVRTPLSGANIVSFSPPDISAGCGGINLYMGSFHFINGQEFLALLRTIGQEALGYAFQLAIDAMCHQCGALLASIEKTIQAMNNSLHNTCQLAHGIFNAGDIAGDFKQVGKNAEKVFGFSSGASTDVSSAYDSANHEGVLQNVLDTFKTNIEKSWDTITSSGSVVKNSKTKSVSAASLIPEGNMFWKAIGGSEAYNMLEGIDDPSTNTSLPCKNHDHACTKEILMSLVGTEILHPGSSTTANADQNAEQESSTQATPNAAYSQSPDTAAPTLTLQDLVNGTKNASVMTCEPWPTNSQKYSAYSTTMGCEAVETRGTTLGSMGFEGIKPHIQHMLFGGGPNDDPGIGPDIEDGTSLSTEQIQFLQTMPGGMYTLLRQAQSSQNMVNEVLALMEPVAVNLYAVNMASALLGAEQSVYSGNPHVVIPKSYGSAINQLAQSEDVYMRDENSDAQKILNAEALVRGLHNTLKKEHGNL